MRAENTTPYLAPRGLLLVGLGASLLGEAIRLKMGRAPLWQWFILGTLSLVSINMGIAIFGEAVKQNTLSAIRAGRLAH